MNSASGWIVGGVIFLVAYLLGSIPTGLLIALRHGIDLRTMGSKNIGATNTGRALGKRWAIIVLILDAAKGIAPVLVARGLDLSAAAMAQAGLGAVLGHCFSIFLRGRGGKGVATSLGVCLGLHPAAAAAAFGVFLVLYAVLRISSVGSLVAVIAFPILVYLLGNHEPATLTLGIALAVLIVARHKDNLVRLARGQELKG